MAVRVVRRFWVGLAMLLASATVLAPSDGTAQEQAAAAPKLTPETAYEAAVIRALDKVAARVNPILILLDEPVAFGSLTVTLRACRTTEEAIRPGSIAFLTIDDTDARGETRTVFSGWMFSESPSLNPLEHPTYDIWLESCSTS